MQRSRVAFTALVSVTALVFVYLIFTVFLRTPSAQMEAGGLAQKIFYFHVPSAYGMYIGGLTCALASGAYLVRATERRNAMARAGAEVALIFGALVLVSGPLWAKKAWGYYWTWDPRLTSLLLGVMIYAAIVVLRAYTADGEAERKFGAALGVLGTILLPVIHFAVRLWGGNHPKVISKGGGGLGHPAMYHSLYVGFFAMTLLTIVFIWLRTSAALDVSRLAELEEEAADKGLL